MYVYDKANELARAIKESGEYKEMVQAKETLAQKQEHVDMIKDFMKIQMNIQTMNMLNQEVNDELKESFNLLYTSMMNIEACRKFLEAQNTFGRLVQDIYKIIGDACNVMDELLEDMMPEA
jgi:cell fate (sporulation/competence/biofilm development) regulator YlbF (YheA/YmcA/DUF963 family)